MRRRGVHPWVWWLLRAVLVPVLHVWLRLRKDGAAEIPREGAVIVASNHRSNLDPLVVAMLCRRPVNFAAKEEMFANRLVGRLLTAAGAFPVRRGRADREMLRTAHAVLERGGCLVIFPEGTRSRGTKLRRPKRGLGEIALDSGAPVVPVALCGTDPPEGRRRPRRRRVTVSACPAQRFTRPADPPPRLSQNVLDEVWSAVEQRWVAINPAPARISLSHLA